MRIAVVGGSGFVGRHVLALLVKQGHQVISVDLPAAVAPIAGVEHVGADILAPDAIPHVAELLAGVEGVVWLAATIRQRHAVDETALHDLELMVRAPLELLQAMQPAPAVFVNISSVQVFGEPAFLPVDSVHPKRPFTAYGVSKLYSESVLGIAGAQRGTCVTNLRLAFVYGVGQHPANAIPHFIREVKAGRPPVLRGDGSEIRDDVCVTDVAAAVSAALTVQQPGSFIVASGQPHSLADVAATIGSMGSPPMSPVTTEEESSWVDRWYHINDTAAALGWAPQVDLESGIAAMWAAAGEAP